MTMMMICNWLLEVIFTSMGLLFIALLLCGVIVLAMPGRMLAGFREIKEVKR